MTPDFHRIFHAMPDGVLLVDGEGRVRDQTERHRLEEFGQRTLQAVEEERQRIARDLHDDTAQHLSTLLLRIRMALDSDRTVGPSFLRDLRREIRQAADGVRRIASNLRPPALREAGLRSVLHTHARRTARTAVLEIVDDGKGFEIAGPPTALAGRGLGLIGIYERARSVDGEAAVASEPGRGTTVRVTIPLAEEERAAS